jgi:hypothetical protein
LLSFGPVLSVFPAWPVAGAVVVLWAALVWAIAGAAASAAASVRTPIVRLCFTFFPS